MPNELQRRPEGAAEWLAMYGMACHSAIYSLHGVSGLA